MTSARAPLQPAAQHASLIGQQQQFMAPPPALVTMPPAAAAATAQYRLANQMSAQPPVAYQSAIVAVSRCFSCVS